MTLSDPATKLASVDIKRMIGKDKLQSLTASLSRNNQAYLNDKSVSS